MSQSPRQRLVAIVAAVVLALGGCALYRADMCRSAQARQALGWEAGAQSRVQAIGDVARWCWP